MFTTWTVCLQNQLIFFFILHFFYHSLSFFTMYNKNYILNINISSEILKYSCLFTKSAVCLHLKFCIFSFIIILYTYTIRIISKIVITHKKCWEIAVCIQNQLFVYKISCLFISEICFFLIIYSTVYIMKKNCVLNSIFSWEMWRKSCLFTISAWLFTISAVWLHLKRCVCALLSILYNLQQEFCTNLMKIARK